MYTYIQAGLYSTSRSLHTVRQHAWQKITSEEDEEHEETHTSEEDYEENECQSQELVDEEEGTTVQQRDVQLGQPPGGTSSSTSIRRLLCDNAACALCERTATEAAEMMCIQRKASRLPPLPQPPLPAGSYMERGSLPGISALRGSAPFPPVKVQ
ncbi:uncharacterized protein LOC140704103 [Pogona vitticeps]